MLACDDRPTIQWRNEALLKLMAPLERNYFSASVDNADNRIR